MANILNWNYMPEPLPKHINLLTQKKKIKNQKNIFQ